MSKSQRSNRETKKHAVLTPKEKKAAKKAKKHAGDVGPLIVNNPWFMLYTSPENTAGFLPWTRRSQSLPSSSHRLAESRRDKK
jgi:hypothetical protein